ncbi:site-specific integrase [Limibacterium fermenti]|uniref:site-specific integrase n=1 Tax=Limibacterium fermenti TaxID=3229863 RepID=UPI000E866CE9|nr:integrase [Porphyromonadaceae bacterium]
MATVKVKFRPSTVKGKAGTIYYQLCHHRKNLQITTRIHLFPEQWDAERGKVVFLSDNEGSLRTYQHQIENDISLLNRIILQLDERPEEYQLSDIVAMFRSRGAQISVLFYLERQITRLQADRKLGTARNYKRTFNSFSLFLGGRDLSFALFNEGLILEYSDYLKERKVVRNTISFYMRNLRSVYNKAVREQIIEQSFPFRNVYTGVDRTCKRAVGEDIIIRLQKLDLLFSPSLSLTRDLFVFSYCTRGMAFVDMAYLRKQNIINGMISYIRHKTGQRLTIRIEPCIKSIIKKYEKKNRDCVYVFPILYSENPEEAFKQYQTALGYYNRKLKRLGELVGSEMPLSSYTSRHTWATMARNYNVPISVISAGMGHTSEKTTQIYLASLENSVIDRANKEILAKLNANISK